MTFGSPAFLFVFMPLVFTLYYVLPMRGRNLFLALASFAFYSVDAAPLCLLLLASVLVNHALGRVLHSLPQGRRAGVVLTAGIAANLIPLLYYKYWVFLQHAAQQAGQLTHVSWQWRIAAILLPPGISFFTFQGISYIVDIYRRDVPPAPSLVDFAMYHSLFPQLIAGPIVRYTEVEGRIRRRPVLLDDVYHGLLRFCLGLGKKIIIADNVGVVADRMFGLHADQLGIGAAWLGIAAYTLQILFDFSGYSDMAIGMGRMLGFRFPENFDQPYRAVSITDFWRRWHQTLSRWFRDYVYIPLGGNRAGRARTYGNLLIVFALCGLWHGAAFTFLLWGLFHGLLLVLERLLRNFCGWEPHGLLGWGWALIMVMIGWVLFRAHSAAAAWDYLDAMAGRGAGPSAAQAWAVLTPDKICFLTIGLLAALVPASWRLGLARRMQTALPDFCGLEPLTSLGALAMFAYSVMLIAANGFNPFIYFRF